MNQEALPHNLQGADYQRDVAIPRIDSFTDDESTAIDDHICAVFFFLQHRGQPCAAIGPIRRSNSQERAERLLHSVVLLGVVALNPHRYMGRLKVLGWAAQQDGIVIQSTTNARACICVAPPT